MATNNHLNKELSEEQRRVLFCMIKKWVTRDPPTTAGKESVAFTREEQQPSRADFEFLKENGVVIKDTDWDMYYWGGAKTLLSFIHQDSQPAIISYMKQKGFMLEDQQGEQGDDEALERSDTLRLNEPEDATRNVNAVNPTAELKKPRTNEAEQWMVNKFFNEYPSKQNDPLEFKEPVPDWYIEHAIMQDVFVQRMKPGLEDLWSEGCCEGDINLFWGTNWKVAGFLAKR